MAQMFDREVEVLVWKFQGITHFGHAALKLRGISPQNGARYAYLSYWPAWGAAIFNAPFAQKAGMHGDAKIDGYYEMRDDVRANLQSGAFQPRAGQALVGGDPQSGKIFYADSLDDMDLENQVVMHWESKFAWVQRPEYRIHLPALGANGVEYGLDVDRIYSWYQAFTKNPNPRYRLASKTRNCAAVVALALKAGGAANYAPPPSAKVFIDPNQIWHWAEELEDALTQMNRSMQNQSQQAYFPLTSQELMSPTQWQKLSTQGVSRFTHRPSQFRKIDSYLRQYFDAGTWTQAPNEKRALLGKMAYQIHNYLASNFNAKREDAVLRLSEEIHNVLGLHPAHNGSTLWMLDAGTMQREFEYQMSQW
jgi:hypothetical protein